MSGRIPHRDRLRRKPTVELDEVLNTLDTSGEGRRLRSSSYSPTRAASTSQETKIARDFSVVTLETDPFRSEGASNGTKASEPKSDPKLSEELFSWRTHRGGRGGSAAEDNLTARSSAMSEDLLSISSDLSEAPSFLSSEGGTMPPSSRRPVSQRTKLGGLGGGMAAPDEEKDSLRNESITVGIGLLLLFFFTYVVQYCARHGYIKIPEHEDIVTVSHDEL